MNAALILSMQVVLALACPPLAVGARKIFLSDLWCMLWVFLCVGLSLVHPKLLEKSEIPRIEFKNPAIRRYFIGSAALLCFVFLHGALRPSLAAPLKEVGLVLSGPEDFDFTRELIIMLRFLSWVWAAAIAFQWARTGALKPKLLIAFTKGAAILCALVIVASQFSEPFRQMLGRIYGYNPDYLHWADRASGTFTSPIEAAATLVFVVVLLFNEVLPILFLSVAIFFTKTISTVFGLAFAAVTVKALGIKKPSSKRVLIVSSAMLLSLVAAVVAVFVLAKHSTFIYGKTLNLTFRMGPWKVYFAQATERLDLLFFGYGFTPYHSDSIFIFLFSRGGLLLLGTFLYFSCRWISKNWGQWSFNQKLIPLFILFSGLTCDILIFRACAALSFSVAACILAFPKNSRIN